MAEKDASPNHLRLITDEEVTEFRALAREMRTDLAKMGDVISEEILVKERLLATVVTRLLEQASDDKITLEEARAYLAEGKHFAKGSMAPKIEAIIRFLENGGKQALITNPENIGRALKGETGTWVVR